MRNKTIFNVIQVISMWWRLLSLAIEYALRDASLVSRWLIYKGHPLYEGHTSNPVLVLFIVDRRDFQRRPSQVCLDWSAVSLWLTSLAALHGQGHHLFLSIFLKYLGEFLEVCLNLLPKNLDVLVRDHVLGLSKSENTFSSLRLWLIHGLGSKGLDLGSTTH